MLTDKIKGFMKATIFALLTIGKKCYLQRLFHFHIVYV